MPALVCLDLGGLRLHLRRICTSPYAHLPYAIIHYLLYHTLRSCFHIILIWACGKVAYGACHSGELRYAYTSYAPYRLSYRTLMAVLIYQRFYFSACIGVAHEVPKTAKTPCRAAYSQLPSTHALHCTLETIICTIGGRVTTLLAFCPFWKAGLVPLSLHSSALLHRTLCIRVSTAVERAKHV